MHFAINTPNFDLYSNVRLLAELAHEAEEAGWDGFFVWDHIGVMRRLATRETLSRMMLDKGGQSS